MKRIRISQYTRRNGTRVRGHTRVYNNKPRGSTVLRAHGSIDKRVLAQLKEFDKPFITVVRETGEIQQMTTYQAEQLVRSGEKLHIPVGLQ